ncbi:TRAP transporter small permease subunit [Paracoccus sp. YIM 132242]|uniref:TRAP transporter small permease protein n=1 Tax=Paracoccus lichenicola TaxID=2665644 RepID=A0A6L6HTC7_9RHOB|nr:TRAP transporter small permease [Paracoccus lichenicola]MTE01639.1 TRAP transporter small permease subunit [Paracoccus lichenicola]
MGFFQRLVVMAGAVLIFALMMLTLFDVVGRNILNHPVRGATELTEIGLVLLSFLLFPIVAVQQRHIVADIADMFQSRILDALQLVLTAALGSAFFALIAWRMWLMAERSARYHDVTASLGIRVAPVLYIVAVLAGFGALCFLLPLRGLPQVLRARPKAHDPRNSIL